MKRGPTPSRVWQTMRPATGFRSAEKTAAIETMLGYVPEISVEMWMNDKYVVSVDRRNDGSVLSLSIRRCDRGWPRDWRDFQHVKNDIAGAEIEAVELYPAESRLVDQANQFWLWCLPPDETFAIGFFDGRVIDDSETAAIIGAKQRNVDESDVERFLASEPTVNEIAKRLLDRYEPGVKS